MEKGFAKFHCREFNLEDEPRLGRSSHIDDDVLRTLVQNTPRISTEKVATSLNVNRSTAFRRLKNMGFDLKLDIWVPHLLTERNKIERISAAVSLLGWLKNEPFWDQLATGDEKGVLYNSIQCKHTWKQAGEHGDTMAKTSLHSMNMMLCVWWNCKGIIYFQFFPAG